MRLQNLLEERAYTVRLLFVLSAFALAGCGELADELTSVGSPVAIEDSPLVERLEDRENADPEINLGDASPEQIAFADASLSGNLVRFHIDTGPSGTGLFAGPGRGYQEVDRLAAGSVVIATGTQTGEWAFIRFGGTEGWVNQRRLSIDEIAPQDIFVAPEIVNVPVTLYETRSSTNIRTEANEDASIVIVAPNRSELAGTGARDGNWIEVTFEGEQGWANANLLTRTATRVLTETGIYETTPITAAPSTTVRIRRPSTTRSPTTSPPRVRATVPPTTATPVIEEGTGAGIGVTRPGAAVEGEGAGAGEEPAANTPPAEPPAQGNGEGGGEGGGEAPAPAPTTAAPAPAPAPTTAAPAPAPTTAAPPPAPAE